VTRIRAAVSPLVRQSARPLVRNVLLCALVAASAAAQSVDHLTIVAPAAPGGGWDQTARALQHVIDVRDLARVVEVQNVPGAAGTIGLSQFTDARRGDGRALLVTGLVMVGATLWNDSPVSVNQATPIARLTGEYEVIAVPASSPLRDLQGLLGEFRRRPEAFAWGGGSAGGTDHILAGLVAEAAGVDPRRVNYVAFSGGGEAVAALMGGHVAAGISGYSEFAAHIASGRLRALAISAPSRLAGVEIPTIREGGINVEMSNWRGLLAPAGISGVDRAALAAIVRAAVRTDDWRRLLAAREWNDQYLEGEDFAAFLRAEQSRYAPVVARLRGPARSEAITLGRRIMPATVLIGGAVIVLLLVAQRLRGHATAPSLVASGEVLSVSLALVAFLLLLVPIGFVGASTAMFVMVARAFSRQRSDSTTPGARTPWLALLIVAAAFCLLVDVAFTRGLDLPLPEGRLLSLFRRMPWMR
jgi:putative tricarboxylic transport membrane protein